MKRKIVSIIIISIITAGFMNYLHSPVYYASGAGSTTVTCNTTDHNDCVFWDNSGGKTWSDLVDSVDIRENQLAYLRVGWHDTTAGGNWHGYWTGLIFDTSELPAGVEVKNVTLRLKAITKLEDYPWLQYYAVFTANLPDDSAFAAGDCTRWWYDHETSRISNVVKYDSFSVGDWVEFEIGMYGGNDGLSYVVDDDNDLVVLYLMTTNHALKYAPIPGGTSDDYKRTDFQGWNHANEPQLVIEYVAEATARTVTVPGNAAVDDTTDGTELVTSVNWTTPRTMYADDDCLVVKFIGDSGALFTGALVNETGTVLEQVDDSVRTDGLYYWEISNIESYSGFVRAWALTDNQTIPIYSKWAYVALAPDSDQRTNDIYSLSTEYPQYDNEFSAYVVQEGDLMFVHWKTNIDGSTELPDYMLCLRKNGAYSGLAFYETLESMHDSYFEGSEANAQALLHWRYAIYTMDDTGPGWNSYDGLVINLALPLIGGNKGFYQPVLLDTTDNTTLLCETHSAYWYLENETEGILMSLNKGTYLQGDDIVASVVLGKPGRVSTYLPDFILVTIGDGSYTTAGTVLTGTNTFELIGVADGTYEARFSFQGGGVENYVYIHEIPFKVNLEEEPDVVQEGAGNIFDNMMNWLDGVGLDNPTGHWLIMLILMAVAFVTAYKSELLRVVFPMGIVGLFIVMGWVDIWVIVLLALGAGLSFYSLFRRKAQGGGEG